MTKKTKIAIALATLGLAGTGAAVGVAATTSSHSPFAAGATPPFAHGGGMMGAAAGNSGAGPMGDMMGAGERHSGVGSTGGMMGAAAGSAGTGGPMRGMMGAGAGKSGAMGMDFSNEFGYLTEMIPHHQEAITTARIVLAGTKRPELKALAQNIIQTQTEQVAQMKQWLATWYPGRDTHVDYKPMMRDLRNLHGAALERAFLQDMIPHHWWAVWASQKLVAQGLAAHQQLVPFATTGIRDPQAAQIHTMIGMLSRWFGESPMQAMAFMHR